MVITQILSYRGAWETTQSKYLTEVSELLDALDEYMVSPSNSGPIYRRGTWETILRRRDWKIPNFRMQFGGRITHNLRGLGPVKNGISAANALGSSDLSKWLFHYSTIAIRNGFIEIPILLVPEGGKGLVRDRLINTPSFDLFHQQLDMLSPLSHPFPFLIIGYSEQSNMFGLQISEIQADPLSTEFKVVDRCIEFPPEYHQAGLNILSFFGKYLREQYPDEDAKVKIEQDGLLVRLTIESKDGKSEIIEKALHEYQLMVSGQQPPEAVIRNESLVMELKNELRLAQVRIEYQQDINKLQTQQVGKLLDIINNGLSKQTSISIDFKPHISAINNLNLNPEIGYIVGGLSELKELIPESDLAQLSIEDLEASLEVIENESNPEVVKKSVGMNKFRKFIERISEGNDDLAKTIKTVESGLEIIKDLAGRYNTIAQWCGLPQVPTIFTK